MSTLRPLLESQPAVVISERERGHAHALRATPTPYAVRGTDPDTGDPIEFRTMATSAPEALRAAAMAGLITEPHAPALVTELPRPRPRIFAPVLAAVLVGALILGALQFIALRATTGESKSSRAADQQISR